MSRTRRQSAAVVSPIPAATCGASSARTRRAVAVAAAFVTLAATPAAGAAAWSAPQDLSAASTESPYPAIAGAGDGAFATVWARAGVPDRPTEWAFRPPGGSWSAPARLSPSPSPTELPYVAVNASGQAAAAWTADGTQYVTVRGTDGTWSTPRAFGTSGIYPSGIGVVIDPTGVVTVVWTEYTLDTARVQAMSRDTAGTWSAPTTLSADGNGLASVKIAADRTVTVLFGGLVTGPGDSRLQVATRSAAGTWSASQPISPPAMSIGPASLDVAPSGAAVVAWTRPQVSDVPAGQVEATLRSTDGTWSTPAVVATSDQQAQLPDVAITPQGTATVAWTSLETQDPGGTPLSSTGTGRILTTSHTAGGTWTTAAPISPTSTVGEYDTVHLAADTTGNTIAVWSTDGAVDAAARGTDGAWSSPERISAAGQSSALPEIAADDSGAVSAAWQRHEGSGWVVQAAIHSDDLIVPGPGPGTTPAPASTSTPAATTPAAPSANVPVPVPAPPTKPGVARAPKVTPKGTVKPLPRSARRRALVTLRTSRFVRGTKLTVVWTRAGHKKAALKTTVRVARNRIQVRAPKTRGTYTLTVKRGTRTLRKGRVRVR